MNFLLRPENSFTFPWIPLDILRILICFHSRQFLCEYVFPWIPLHRSFQFLLLPMTKKRTLGKVQIERYLDSFPYTSLSLRCCCSRFCRLVGARVPIHPQILADHLTLHQPGGAGYAHQYYYWHPRIFRPSYGSATRQRDRVCKKHDPSYASCQELSWILLCSHSYIHCIARPTSSSSSTH